MSHFENYSNVPMVSEIKEQIDIIQHDFRRHVQKVFREIGQLVDTVADAESLVGQLPGQMSSLSDACLIVDALGEINLSSSLTLCLNLSLACNRLFLQTRIIRRICTIATCPI